MIQAIRSLSPRRILIVILLVKILLGVFYVTQQPLWQYHEADFLRVVRYLRDEGKLPVLAADANPDTNNTSQPPLYYFLLLPFVTAVDDNQPAPASINPTAVCEGYNTNLTSLLTTTADDPPLSGTVALGYILRLFSLATSLIAVVFTYLAGRVLFPKKPFIGLLGAALIAFEPTSMIVATQINNDTLILALGAVHLWLCARLIHQRGSLSANLVGLLVVAVLALLAKLSGWLMLGISLVLIAGALLPMTRQRASRRQKQVAYSIVGLLLTAVVGIAIFNFAQYGSLLGRYRGLETTIEKTLQNLPPRHIILMTAATLQDTFTDYLSPLRQLQPHTIVLLAYIALLGLCGVAGLFGIGQAIYRRDKSLSTSFALLVGYALLMIALVIFRALLNNGNPDFINTMIIISPVRYYAPALPALLLICAAGFAAFMPSRLPVVGNLAGMVIAGCWFVISLAGLSGLVNMSQMRSDAIMSQEQFDALQGVTSIDEPQATELPQILGYQIQTHPADGLVDLSLYVRTNHPLTENFALQTSLSSGGQRGNCTTMPVRGLYPTPRWQPDKIIVLHTEIPNCIVRRDPPIELDFQWLTATSADELATTIPAGSRINVGTINDMLEVAAACPVNKGVIGGGLQLLKYNTPTTLNIQTDPVYFVPSVNWLVRDLPAEAVNRIYVITQASSSTTYQCSGVPRQNTYPFARWSLGETIYFDECVTIIPKDAPKGDYVISVGVQDVEGKWLSAVDSSGTPLADGLVPIGTLQVE